MADTLVTTTAKQYFDNNAERDRAVAASSFCIQHNCKFSYNGL